LEVFHLLRSTTGKGEDVECEYNLLFAAVLTETDIMHAAGIDILEREVGRHVAYFGHSGTNLLGRDSRKGLRQYDRSEDETQQSSH
jgi:hypothetical protein